MLSPLLFPKAIKIHLESKDKEGVLGELLDLLVATHGIANRDEAMGSLLQREAQQSTGIGGGIAIPHGHVSGLKSCVAGLGISKEGVDYGALDGEPVFIVFLLLAGSKSPGQMVHGLSEFARLFADPAFCLRIRQAKTGEEVMTLVRIVESWRI